MNELMSVACVSLSLSVFAGEADLEAAKTNDTAAALGKGVYGITLTQKELIEKKVVTSTLNGIYVKGYGAGKDGAYIWDKSYGDTYTNTFVKADSTTTRKETWDTATEAEVRVKELEGAVGTDVGDVVADSIYLHNRTVNYKIILKKNTVKVANGYAEPFQVVCDEDSVAHSGKVDAGFNWDSMKGWGTGTSKNAGEDVETIKSVAGNTVDQKNRTYGTWKFQYDSKATKLADEDASIEQILATKKVELCK